MSEDDNSVPTPTQDFGIAYNAANKAHDALPEPIQKFFAWTGLTDVMKRATGGVDSKGQKSDSPLLDGKSITQYGLPGALGFLFFSMKLGWDFKFSTIGAAVVSFVAGKLFGLTGLFNEKSKNTGSTEPVAKIDLQSVPGGTPIINGSTGPQQEPAGP